MLKIGLTVSSNVSSIYVGLLWLGIIAKMALIGWQVNAAYRRIACFIGSSVDFVPGVSIKVKG